MATVSDVEDAIAALIGTVLYPTGSPPSTLGYPIKIESGWPDPATLDTDMVETAPGIPTKAHVSIYPPPGMERNTTRYAPVDEVGQINPTTYTLAAAGQVITVGGAAPGTFYAQNIGVFVDGRPYIIGATTGQTPSQIAAALQALIVAAVSGATVTGPAITIPAGHRIGALRLGTSAATAREVRRQEKQFQISTWTSNPASRAAICDAFDPVLADAQFLALADGSGGRLKYVGTRDDDFTQKQRIYRRSLIYTVEYPTLRAGAATQILAVTESLRDAQGNLITSTTS